MNKDPFVELIERLCDDLTKDIKNMGDKIWLVPALVSHVTTLSGHDEKRVKLFVHAWYKNV